MVCCKRTNEKEHTQHILSNDACMAQVLFLSGAANPVPPRNLGFDDTEGLVARVVAQVLDEYPASKNGEVYGPFVTSA